MTDRPGRPRATTRADLERVALDCFARNGFDATTVEDIAATAGISRRTFFRYYPSKNDVVWGDFDQLLAAMDTWLTDQDPDWPVLGVVREAVVRFNTLPAEAVPAHRLRMNLILHVPALQAHSTLRYAAWRDVIARFAATRHGLPVGHQVPQLLGHTALAAAVASYEQWLANETLELGSVLRASFELLEHGLQSDQLPPGPSARRRPLRH